MGSMCCLVMLRASVDACCVFLKGRSPFCRALELLEGPGRGLAGPGCGSLLKSQNHRCQAGSMVKAAPALVMTAWWVA